MESGRPLVHAVCRRRGETGKEQAGAPIPAVMGRLHRRSTTVSGQRASDRFRKIFIKRANSRSAAVDSPPIRTENIGGAGHRICRNRKAAGQSLYIDQAERVRAAWKDEDVGCLVDGGELRTVFGAKELH